MKKENNFNKQDQSEAFRSQRGSTEKEPGKNDDRVEGKDEDLGAQDEGNYGHKSQDQAEEDGRRGENHD